MRNKTKPSGYLTYGQFSVDEVLPLIGNGERLQFDCGEHGTISIKMNSERLICFKQNIVCVRCRVMGILFRLQRHQNDQQSLSLHMNLYGLRNGRMILFTKDHIVPRSKGGQSSLSNYQTMCYDCNQIKGNKYKKSKGNES